jgi:two-component system nitrate/nitrite response regulator NarL
MSKNKPKIRIIIAEDHAIFRHGLRALLADQQEFEVVGEASNGDEALKLVEQLQPDLLLLDLSMPSVSGMDVLRLLPESRSNVRTIILTVALRDDEIPIALKLGARGFVLKDSGSVTLFESIKAVMAGQYWINAQSVASSQQVLKRIGVSKAINKPNRFGLSPREIQILKDVVSGRSNKDIAKHLSISEHTVKHHITAIFDKLGVYNRLELALFAHHHGIIEE